jgi:hypothetical protein
MRACSMEMRCRRIEIWVGSLSIQNTGQRQVNKYLFSHLESLHAMHCHHELDYMLGPPRLKIYISCPQRQTFPGTPF